MLSHLFLIESDLLIFDTLGGSVPISGQEASLRGIGAGSLFVLLHWVGHSVLVNFVEVVAERNIDGVLTCSCSLLLSRRLAIFLTRGGLVLVVSDCLCGRLSQLFSSRRRSHVLIGLTSGTIAILR